VITGLAEAVAPVISHDRDLAKRLATTVLTFNEMRDEQVAFGGSALLTMSEDRRQQAGHAVYMLGEAFDELCAADLLTAAELFCTIAEEESERPSRGDWPMTVAGAEGWLRYGQDLSVTKYEVGTTAARAVSAALTAADPAAAQPVIAVLVEQLHSAAAWAAIMTSTDDAVALGKNLLPAIESGALLVHPQSHAAAAGLLRALADSEPTLAGRLEQAVLRAHAIGDANGVSERVKDALIGCLQRDSIASPGLRSRLDELGPDAIPDVEPFMRVTSWSRPWSLVDSLAADGDELDPKVASAAQCSTSRSSWPRVMRPTSPNANADCLRRSPRPTRRSRPSTPCRQRSRSCWSEQPRCSHTIEASARERYSATASWRSSRLRQAAQTSGR
jgi:hypothetical protein